MYRYINDLYGLSGAGIHDQLRLADSIDRFAYAHQDMMRTAGLDAIPDYMRSAKAASLTEQAHRALEEQMGAKTATERLLGTTAAFDGLRKHEESVARLSDLGLPDYTSLAAKAGAFDSYGSSAYSGLTAADIDRLSGYLVTDRQGKQLDRELSASLALTAAARRNDLAHALASGDWAKFQPATAIHAARALTDYQRMLDASGMAGSVVWSALEAARLGIDSWLIDHDDDQDQDQDQDHDDEAAIDEEELASVKNQVQVEGAEQGLTTDDPIMARIREDMASMFRELPLRFRRIAMCLEPWEASDLCPEHPWVNSSPQVIRVLELHSGHAAQIATLYGWASRAYTRFYMAPKGQAMNGPERISYEEVVEAAHTLYLIKDLLDEIESK